ncbi:MAG: preprotein translocase subunit SecE [Chloroflexota bacterium]
MRSAGEVLAELKKVTWPTRQETVRLTIVVLLICLALGVFLGGMDYGFSELAKRFFGR